MSVVDGLVKLSSIYQGLDQTWAKNIIEENFTNYEQVQELLTSEVEDYEGLLELLTELLSLFETEEIDWLELRDGGCNPAVVICTLWLNIEAGSLKKSTSMWTRIAGVSACLYIALSSLKHAKQLKVFNEYLYVKTLHCFRMLYRLLRFGSKTKLMEMKRDKGAKLKGKGKKNNTHLIALSPYPNALQETVDVLRDYGRESNRETRVRRVEKREDLRGMTLPERVFAVMHLLAEDRHSLGATAIYAGFVLPRLAYWTFEADQVHTIPMSMKDLKNLLVQFVSQRVAVANEEEMETINSLVMNLIGRCPERQEYRLNVAQSVLDVFQILPSKQQTVMLQMIYNWSLNFRASPRGVCLEMLPMILDSFDAVCGKAATVNGTDEAMEQSTIGPNKERRKEDSNGSHSEQEEPESEEEDEQEAKRKKKQKDKKKKKPEKEKLIPVSELERGFYFLLVRACQDKNSTIRARGLSHLVSLLKDEKYRSRIIDAADKALLDYPKMFTGDSDDNPKGKRENNKLGDDTTISIPNPILYLLSCRIDDNKAMVRKAAVVALHSFFSLIENAEDAKEAIECIQNRCLDEQLSVRKQAVEVLSALLTESINGVFREKVEDAWLKSVLPLINDRETSVQQMAAKHIEMHLVRLVLQSETSDETWRILKKVEQKGNNRRLLLRTLYYLSRESALNEKVANVLHAKLADYPERASCIWMLLSDLSAVFKVDPRPAFDKWMSLKRGETDNMVRYIAKVLGEGAQQMATSDRETIAADIQEKLLEFAVEAAHIPAVYLCLARLLDAVGEEAAGKKVLERIGHAILAKCCNIINQECTRLDSADDCVLLCCEKILIRVVSTIGEVIQLSPELLDKTGELLKGLQFIIASKFVQEGFKAEHLASAMQSRVPSRAQTQPSQPTQSTEGPCSQAGSAQLGPLPSVIPEDVHKRENFIRVSEMLFTKRLRGYAVIACGKFCLMDEDLAKKVVPVFVRQLKVNDDHIIRNNIVIVLCDLCIRYTLLVDRYAPIIASCLKDESTLVRHQTLESLTNLIKEQFILWEGQIMYRFVSTILDEDAQIREHANFCLKNVLLPLMPFMFSAHFVECLLYFNDIPKPFKGQEDVDEEVKFSLCGAENCKERMTVYKFMISTFDDIQKFTTMGKICDSILRKIICGDWDIKEPKVVSLLRDVLDIMQCEEMRLKMALGKRNAGDEDDEELPEAVHELAKKGMTEGFRKAIISSIMPTLLDLRLFLRSNPLYGRLTRVFCAIIRDHEQYIEEFCVGMTEGDGGTFKSEIENEMREIERIEKRREEKAKALAAKEKEKRRSIRKSLALVALARQEEESMIVDDDKEPGEGKSEEVKKEQQTAEVNGDRDHSRMSGRAPDQANKTASSTVRQRTLAPQGSLSTDEANPGVTEVKKEVEENLELEVEMADDVQVKEEEMEVEEGQEIEDAGRGAAVSESAHGVAASENAERENMDAQKKRRSPRLYGGQGQIGTPTCQPERLLSNTAAKKGKREVREGSAATMSSEAMDEAVVDGGRAHSTPKKSNAPNATFMSLDMSAILPAPTVSSRRGTKQKVCEVLKESDEMED